MKLYAVILIPVLTACAPVQSAPPIQNPTASKSEVHAATIERLDRIETLIREIKAERDAVKKEYADYRACIDRCEDLPTHYELPDKQRLPWQNDDNTRSQECYKRCNEIRPMEAVGDC